MKFHDFTEKYGLGIKTLKSPESSTMTTEILCSEEFFLPVSKGSKEFFFSLTTTSPSIHKKIGLWMSESSIEFKAMLVAIYREYRVISMSSNKGHTIVLEEGVHNISFSITPPFAQGDTLMIWMFVS